MVSLLFYVVEFQCCMRILKSERSQLFLVSPLHIPQTLQNQFRRALVCSTVRYLFVIQRQRIFPYFYGGEHIFHVEIVKECDCREYFCVKEPLFRAVYLNLLIFNFDRGIGLRNVCNNWFYMT